MSVICPVSSFSASSTYSPMQGNVDLALVIFYGIKVSVAKIKEVLNNSQFSIIGLILEASRFFLSIARTSN